MADEGHGPSVTEVALGTLLESWCRPGGVVPVQGGIHVTMPGGGRLDLANSRSTPYPIRDLAAVAIGLPPPQCTKLVP